MEAKGGVELRTGVVEKNAGGAGYRWPRSGFLPLLVCRCSGKLFVIPLVHATVES